jgi:hypothetical protein
MVQARMSHSRHQVAERVVVLRDWRCLEPMDEPSPTSVPRKREALRRNAAKWQPLQFLLSPPAIVVVSAIFAALLLTAVIMWVSVTGFALAAAVVFHLLRTYVWPRLKSNVGPGTDKAAV